MESFIYFKIKIKFYFFTDIKISKSLKIINKYCSNNLFKIINILILMDFNNTYIIIRVYIYSYIFDIKLLNGILIKLNRF